MRGASTILSDARATESSVGLAADLAAALAPDRVLTRTIDRIAYANDASVYRLVPRVVVRPRTTAEVARLFDVARRHRMPLTFRTAGTSLSGQAVTDGILADVARHWRTIDVLDGGRRVRVEPGAIGGMVNRHLAPHGTKIGPDPASIDACMMGGILSNNSSGMCCGVTDNAYRTLESIRFVLPDGLELDTADPAAATRLCEEAPHLAAGLAELRRRVLDDRDLTERIRVKYRMKNTTGYSLNAFVDFERPLDVLAHLLVGAEGTLAFIAEAVLRSVPDLPHKSTGLLFFPDVPRACAAIAPLRESGARALELMDRASLRAIARRPGAPADFDTLPPGAAAVLVEYQCADPAALAERERAGRALLPGLPLLHRIDLTRDPAEQAQLWSYRKGLIPSVGALRRRGTSFILEDIVFPVERLASGVAELQELFARHGYDDAIVFGHAKDGNLHFVLVQAFDDPADVRRYDAFMQDLAVLVAGRYGGALKAEHGTGRNMAPFVAAEWGSAAYSVMHDLKRLVDPDGILNPGVILNDDPRAHVLHLKDLPAVEPEVDRCIECGFCERMCPSRDLTLTPRQRIVVRREMARLRAASPQDPRLAELERDWAWDGLDTCAADGLCATACPVEIDTGALVRRLRGEAHGDVVQELAVVAANRFALIERGARAALRVARWAGAAGLLPRSAGGGNGELRAGGSTNGSRPSSEADASGWPAAAGRLPIEDPAAPEVVYFPTCLTRILDDRHEPLAAALVRVARRAGRPVRLPADAPGHCCGLAFASKGLDRAYRQSAGRTVDALWRWSDRGALPVVVDASPCTLALRHAAADLDEAHRERLARLEILDGPEFAARLLERLAPRRIPGPIALHPVCSVIKLGGGGALRRVAEACAEHVDVPRSAGCCGFAGDRGFRVPELTAAATAGEAVEIAARGIREGYSSSRTCEIGLARATGLRWRSLWHLLDEATSVERSAATVPEPKFG